MPREMTPEEPFERIEKGFRRLSRITTANTEQIRELKEVALLSERRFERIEKMIAGNTEQIRELQEVALLNERRFERVEKMIAGNTDHAERLQMALVRIGESLDRHIEESREDRRAIRTLLQRFGGLPS
jgi:ribosomal protein L35